MQIKTYLFLLFVILFIYCNPEKPMVHTGLDRVDQLQDIFTGRRVGIVTNHTAYNSAGRYIVDVFMDLPDVQITALFGPEHGITGNNAAGAVINDSLSSGRIPIYSLYGVRRKPTVEMLANVDLLVFDIQDIGTRYYTYIYTMALAMEAAAEQGKSFVVLDRPNPINGISVEGNILDTTFATFVGMFPIPVRHGLTIGELAQMFAGEGWIKKGRELDLHVIKLENWQRNMWFDETGLTWRAPSPNMPSLAVATVYPGTCLLEGTNLSEGRGTYQPFIKVGAPWFSETQFLYVNKILDYPGIQYGPIEFVPRPIPDMAPVPKHAGERVIGLALKVTDRNQYRPYLNGIALVKLFYENNPELFQWRERHFDRLCGTDQIRKFIIAGKRIEAIEEWIDRDLDSFNNLRQSYLLY